MAFAISLVMYAYIALQYMQRGSQTYPVVYPTAKVRFPTSHIGEIMLEPCVRCQNVWNQYGMEHIEYFEGFLLR
jgi:hypothetical protein